MNGPQPGAADHRSRVNRVWRAALALTVLMIVAIPGILAADARAASESTQTPGGRSCDNAPATTGGERETVDAADVPVATAPEQAQVRNLGISRSPVNMQTIMRLSQPLPRGVQHLNVLVGQFTRADGGGLDPGQVVARADVSPQGRRDVLQLWVCVDPLIPDPGDETTTISAEPGSYSGTVLLDDLRVGSASGSYVVNLSYPNMWTVLLVWIVCGLVGLVAGIALSTGLKWGKLKKSRIRLTAALGAAAAAAYAILTAQYLSNPAWVGDMGAFIALAAATVGASYGAANFAGSGAVAPAEPPPDQVANGAAE